jgi:hypothetical protein
MFIGGFGSGKSFSGVFKTILFKLNNPNANTWFLEPTFSLIANIALPEFCNQLDRYKIKYKLNKSGPWIQIQDQRGKIHFRTMSEPGRLVGENIAFCVIDEADTLKEEAAQEVFVKVLGRLRQHRDDGLDPQLCFTSTPEGFRAAYSIYTQNKDKPIEDFHFIRASTTENKFLPASYIASMRDHYTPELLKAYLDGEFVNLKGNNVYSYFSRAFVKKLEEPIVKELHIGQDFNVDANVSIVTWIHKDHIHVIDVIVAKDTFETSRIIRERYPDYNINIYPDASGKNRSSNATETDIDILRKHFNVFVKKANPRILERVNIVNRLFRDKRISIADSGGNIDKFILALEQQIYDSNSMPEKSCIHPSNDDYNDAFGYLLYYLYNTKNTKVTEMVTTMRFG